LKGEACEKGIGTQADRDEAIKWYRLAAEREDHVGEPAREALARMGAL